MDKPVFYTEIPESVVPGENLSPETKSHASEILDEFLHGLINIGKLTMDAV